jgi:hypothetical protein
LTEPCGLDDCTLPPMGIAPILQEECGVCARVEPVFFMFCNIKSLSPYQFPRI